MNITRRSLWGLFAGLTASHVALAKGVVSLPAPEPKRFSVVYILKIETGKLENFRLTRDEARYVGHSHSVSVGGHISSGGHTHSFTKADFLTKAEMDHAIRMTSTPVVPEGTIIMWTGDKIPEGYALCDGKNGTPDLRKSFVAA